jgi:hypothetical protein
MSKKNVTLPVETIMTRLAGADIFSFSYKNPFVLSFLYYTEGMSTVEIGELLGCEQRTVRRYMNFYGFRRFTKDFALLVKHHGVQDAMKLKPPTFYPLGVHND